MAIVPNNWGGIKGFVPKEDDPVMVRRSFTAILRRIELLERFVYKDALDIGESYLLVDDTEGDFGRLLLADSE